MVTSSIYKISPLVLSLLNYLNNDLQNQGMHSLHPYTSKNFGLCLIWAKNFTLCIKCYEFNRSIIIDLNLKLFHYINLQNIPCNVIPSTFLHIIQVTLSNSATQKWNCLSSRLSTNACYMLGILQYLPVETFKKNKNKSQSGVKGKKTFI